MQNCYHQPYLRGASECRTSRRWRALRRATARRRSSESATIGHCWRQMRGVPGCLQREEIKAGYLDMHHFTHHCNLLIHLYVHKQHKQASKQTNKHTIKPTSMQTKQQPNNQTYLRTYVRSYMTQKVQYPLLTQYTLHHLRDS